MKERVAKYMQKQVKDCREINVHKTKYHKHIDLLSKQRHYTTFYSFQSRDPRGEKIIVLIQKQQSSFHAHAEKFESVV